MILMIFVFSLSFVACGEELTKDEYADYKNQMSNFFESIEKIDAEMNSIAPNDADSFDKLFDCFDRLEKQFKYLSEIEPPEQFEVTKELAEEAYDYMKQANSYFKESFSDNSYNQGTLDAAIECYSRANKRMQYIVNLIHGEIPEDENITVEE